MHDGDQLERLKSWNESYQDVFKALREDPEINTWAHGKDFLHNGFYGTPDAEIYAAFIMDAKPRNIVEIGAGFSTLIARKAVDELSNHCRITTIDPAPRAEIGNAADTLISKCVEDVEPNEIPLHERALLFIDSSHIARSGGDVPYLYNRLIPVVPSGTLVHVDDIFIPYDYPHRYQKMLFTEQYVVHALLSHSNRCRIAFATHYMTRQYGEIMRDVLSRVVGKEDDYHGSSLWFWVED